MSKETFSPEAAYLTSPNIVHPQSIRGTPGDAYVTADEGRARSELTARRGVNVTGGTIRKGR